MLASNSRLGSLRLDWLNNRADVELEFWARLVNEPSSNTTELIDLAWLVYTLSHNLAPKRLVTCVCVFVCVLFVFIECLKLLRFFFNDSSV